jgi:hypothetical protein
MTFGPAGAFVVSGALGFEDPFGSSVGMIVAR